MNRPSAPTLVHPSLRPFLRRGAYTALVCVGVGLLLGLLADGRFADNLLYALIIGTLCWLAVDGGRLLVARTLVRAGAEGTAAGNGWPGWGWMTLVIVVGVSIAYTLGTLLGDALTGHSSPLPGSVRWRSFAYLLLMSITVSAVVTGFFYTRARLARALAEAEAARRSAAETQLKLLQSQLEPHMLFNTLANLRVLIGVDAARAQDMLDHLIAFLRATLNASRSGMHPLAAEFDRIADYLALMTPRMGPRLAVELDLPDELRALPVPPLLLQPLVENAIKHGLEPKVAGGRLTVTARREREQLVLSVRDTGVGVSSHASDDGTHFGLAQVRERLATLYGDRASVVIEPAADADGGALARIVLPWPAGASK